MQKLILFIWALLMVMMAPAQNSKPIKGNGRITTRTYTPQSFTAVDIGTFCNVTLTCGAMPMVKVTAKENLHEYLKVDVSDGVLTFVATAWLEETGLGLEIQTPFITKFTTAGWGNIDIRHVNTREFTLVATIGNVNVSGKVDRLRLTTGVGNVDASSLQARYVEIAKQGSGNIHVMATDTLVVEGSYSMLQYEGSPVILYKNGQHTAEKALVEEDTGISKDYVTVYLRNNSGKKQDFFIRGPAGHRFSYGFPIGAFRVRKETAPVGSKIWQELLGIKGSKLVELTADMEGKTLDLFPNP